MRSEAKAQRSRRGPEAPGGAATLSPPRGVVPAAGPGGAPRLRRRLPRPGSLRAAATTAPRHGAAAAARPAPQRRRAAAPAPAPLLFLLFRHLRPLRAGRLPAPAPAGLPAGRDPRRLRLLPGVRPRRGRAVRGRRCRQGALRAGHGVREEPQEAEG